MPAKNPKKSAKPAKSPKVFVSYSSEDREAIPPWNRLNKFGTVPKTFRFPEQVAAQMDYLAAQMNTTTGKWLLGILEDVLPMFHKDVPQDQPPALRQVKVYRAMKANDLLTTVNWDELLEKIKFASNRKGE